jgi:hypothetical protein
MKKSTSKLREELARLEEELKQAETRDAVRIGRIALKAGLGEIQIDDADLLAALEEMAKRFRDRKPGSTGKERGGATLGSASETTPLGAGAAAGQRSEA